MAYDNEDDLLQIYLNDIQRYDLLSREEEDALVKEALSGNEEARERLLSSHLRFVVSVAKKYQNQGLPLMDLINEGNIGLINALEKFDPDKGFHFISYAVWWIRQAILKAINEKSRAIRLPGNRANELVQIEKARKALRIKGADDRELEELAEAVFMDKENVKNLLEISRDLVSLDAKLSSSKSSDSVATFGDLIKDENYMLPEDKIVRDSLADDINVVLNTLPKKEAEIIEYRFGLNGKIAMSLNDIANIYYLTKERIRQIEKKALSRIRNSNKLELLESHVA